MSTQTNAMLGSPVQPHTLGPAVVSSTQQIYWALRREFWENRAIYLAPLGVAAIFLVGFAIHLPMHGASAHLGARGEVIGPYDISASLLMGTFLIIAVFYCVEALQRERRDRSILFWKSLPVSDVTTVAAKASIPFLVLPILCCAITFVTQSIMLLIGSAVAGASGLSAGAYWSQVPLLQMSLLLLYHVMTVHVLASAPVYGYLLFVSGWARRAVFLWAVLPPVAIIALEKLVLGTGHFGHFLLYFLTGRGTEAVMAPNSLPMDSSTHLTPLKFLTSAALWAGLAVTAAFLYAAVRLRRYRGPN